MMVKTVTFSHGGHPLIVNAGLIASIQPYEASPETKTLLNLFGIRIKVSGNVESIRTALGWEKGICIGFDGSAITNEAAPGEHVEAAKQLSQSTGKKFTASGGIEDLR